MHALSATISSEHRRQSGVAHEVRRGVDQRFGDRREDEHAQRNDTVRVCMRIWIDLTNSPHVLVMRPVIERLQADGHEVRVTARDFAQTIELCERFGIAHTAIGHHRGERLAAKAAGLASRSAALVRWARAASRAAGARRFDLALGHGSNDVSVAAAILRVPARRCSTTSGRPSSTTSTAAWPGRSWCPGAIPPERLDRYGARGKVRAYEGLKEEYYLADFEPDPAVLVELALDRARPIVVVRTPPEVSLYHRFENDLFAAGARPPARRRRAGGRAAGGAAARGLPARGARPRAGLRRARARDRRAVADRLRRPRDLRRRHHEPRGGGARDPGVHDLRRAAGRRGRSG